MFEVKDRMLNRVGGIPISELRVKLMALGCPTKRVHITFSNGERSHPLHMDLKASGRIFMFDGNRNDQGRLWLSYEEAPAILRTDYGCRWDYKITRYERSQSKLKIFCEVPAMVLSNLRMVMDGRNS